MAIEPTKSEVIPVNLGDLALTDPNNPSAPVDRASIANITNFKRNVLPGDVVNRKEPTANYQFYWYMEIKDSEFSENEFADLEEAGFFFVNEKDFDVKRWVKSADGRIKSGRFYLMACPEREYMRRKHEKEIGLGAKLDEGVSGFHAMADKLGVGTWETRGGRTREVVKGKSISKLLDN